MTEESYQRNVRRGVTGEYTATCLPAALDRVSLWHGITPQTYEDYAELFWDRKDKGVFAPDELVGKRREVWRRIASELGVPTPNNIIMTHCGGASELEKYLAKLNQGNYRIGVTLKVKRGLHTVGLVPQDNSMYEVRATWHPFADDVVDIGEIASNLDKTIRVPTRAHNSRRAVKAENVIALPPERKRR